MCLFRFLNRFALLWLEPNKLENASSIDLSRQLLPKDSTTQAHRNVFKRKGG